MNQHAPALTRAIAAINAGADERDRLARIERKARIRKLVTEYAAESTGLLGWLGQAKRYVGCIGYWTYAEAICDLTGRVHVERRYCRARDWKARPDLAAAQWDRLLVARCLRRMAARDAKREAA